MKTDNTLAAKGGEARETRAERAIRLLTTMAGNPFNNKLEEFKPFYPAVVTAKRNGMKNKQIIKILAEAGVKVYPALFEKLLTAMRGDPDMNTCSLCGQAIDGPVGEAEHVDPLLDEGPGVAEDHVAALEGA